MKTWKEVSWFILASLPRQAQRAAYLEYEDLLSTLPAACVISRNHTGWRPHPPKPAPSPRHSSQISVESGMAAWTGTLSMCIIILAHAGRHFG